MMPIYLQKIMAIWNSGALDRNKVYDFLVVHDDDCPFLLSGGPCTCTPDIEVREINIDEMERQILEDYEQ